MKYELLTPSQMAAADSAAISRGVSGETLMRNAGEAIAAAIIDNFEIGRALVLCGPGNNGGDGFVVANLLLNEGWLVQVCLFGEKHALRGDAKLMADEWDGELLPFAPELLENSDLVVDAIFGAGLSRKVEGAIAASIDVVNSSKISVVSVDVPTGMDGSTGQVNGVAVQADMTVTFARLKPGHVLLPGRTFCGEVVLADIGIEDGVIAEVGCTAVLNHPDLWPLPNNKSSGHKFDRGHCLVWSGEALQTGASRLSATAALRAGAGLVTLAGSQDALMVHAAHVTSIMLHEVQSPSQLGGLLKDDRFKAIVLGPAAGIGSRTCDLVATALQSGVNCVLDADALSSFADDPDELFSLIGARDDRSVVLTPHGGEFGRIFPDLDESNKLEAARKAAQLSGAIILFKGADTVIASPDGRIVINDHAPPTLATAGSGDVLAGIIAGLLSQGVPGFEAACAGAFLHGQAALEFGKPGLIAEDLPQMIPDALETVAALQSQG